MNNHMKTRIFLFCLGLLCLTGTAGYAQNLSFTIEGKLVNVQPMPVKVYMTGYVKGLLKKDLDSAVVTNGAYHFTGELLVDEAVMVTLSPEKKDNGSNGFAVYLDKGVLNLVSDGPFKQFKATGTAAVAQQEHEGVFNGITLEREDLLKIVKTEAYKTDKKLQIQVLERSRALSTKGLVDFYIFAKNNPGKRSAPFMTYVLLGSGLLAPQGQDTLERSLPPHVKADRLGQEIAHVKVRRDSLIKQMQLKQQAEAGKIPMGSKAPEFTQLDRNNKPVTLSSFKGKYVLVDFWASWCMPCRAENPNVVKAYNKYKDKGFTVLGVSLDAQSGRNAWLKAIASDGLTWTQVSDLKGWKNEAADAYGVSSIPQNFLIDPNGIVIGKNLRGDELNAKLASLFK